MYYADCICNSLFKIIKNLFTEAPVKRKYKNILIINKRVIISPLQLLIISSITPSAAHNQNVQIGDR
jgi:hypothetical protein